MDKLIVNNAETYTEGYDISRNFKNTVVDMSDPLYGTDKFTLSQAITICPKSILDKYKRIKFIDSILNYYVEYENDLYFSSKELWGWFNKSRFPEYIDKKLPQGRTLSGANGANGLSYDGLFDIILDIKINQDRDMSKFIHIGKIKYELRNQVYLAYAPSDDIDNYDRLNWFTQSCTNDFLAYKITEDISIFKQNDIYLMVNITKLNNIPSQNGSLYGLIGKGIHLDQDYLYDMTRGPIAQVLMKNDFSDLQEQFTPINDSFKNFKKITDVSDSDTWTTYLHYNSTTFSGFGGYYGYLYGDYEGFEFYVKTFTQSLGEELETNTLTLARLTIVDVNSLDSDPVVKRDLTCNVEKGVEAAIRFFIPGGVHLDGYYFILVEGNAFMSMIINNGIDVYTSNDISNFVSLFGEHQKRGSYTSGKGFYDNVPAELKNNYVFVFNYNSSLNGLWLKMNILKKVYILNDYQIENIKSRIEPEPPEPPEPQQTEVDFILPDKVYAVIGDTLQLFVRGFVNAYDPYQLNINCLCDKGRFYKRHFDYTPGNSDSGTSNLKFNIKDIAGNVLKTKTISLITKGTITSPSSNKNIACFGDSLTSGGQWCQEFMRRLTGSGGTPAGRGLSNINFIGPFVTASGCNYFGVGGWSWDSYTTSGRPSVRFQVSGVNTIGMQSVYTYNSITYQVIEINITNGSGNILCIPSTFNVPSSGGTLTKQSGVGDDTISFSSAERDSQNPLWDYDTSKMTFVPYANKYGNGSIDVVYVLLSWNGQSAYRTDFSLVTNQIKKFADTLHSEYPNAKLKIMGIPLPSQNGGCTINYGCTDGYGDYFGITITALNQAKAYQDFANQSAYSSFVEYVPVACQFDSEYNMPEGTSYVNTRSDVTERRGTNGVHPSLNGYYQIADACYRNFVYNYC